MLQMVNLRLTITIGPQLFQIPRYFELNLFPWICYAFSHLLSAILNFRHVELFSVSLRAGLTKRGSTVRS